MANPEHLKILKQGVKAWNKWRKENPNDIPDLSGADLGISDLIRVNLFGANLYNVDFCEAELVGADLHETNLNNAMLAYANLTGANINEAGLVGSDLTQTNMKKANLRNADMRYCIMPGCNLSAAIMTGVRLYGTARDDWEIKDVTCEYVYWDYEGEQRSPKDRDLEPGEFERLYAKIS
jgi:hypothetical protein